MKIPIIILTRNRPRQLIDMIDAIEKNTDKDSYEIILCDNQSTFPEMLRFLNRAEKKYKVYINSENLLFSGFNPALKDITQDYFILSDPDIIIPDTIPKNWISVFISILEKTKAPKVGVALKIDDIKKDRISTYEWELGFWSDKTIIDDCDCYCAPIDTTLAMYRKDTFPDWECGKIEFNNFGSWGEIPQVYNKKYCQCFRVGGDFTSKHTGWYFKEYESENMYYKKYLKNSIVSTSMQSQQSLQKDAVIFSAYAQDNYGVNVFKKIYNETKKNIQNIDMYIGINPGNGYEYKLISFLNDVGETNYSITKQEFVVNSDASGYQTALALYMKSKKEYRNVLFLHTKGNISHDEQQLNDLLNILVVNYNHALFVLDSSEGIGGYTKELIQYGKYNEKPNEAIKHYLNEDIKNICYFCQGSFYIIKDYIVKWFFEKTKIDFFSEKLYDWFDNRYFFERDFPTIVNAFGSYIESEQKSSVLGANDLHQQYWNDVIDFKRDYVNG